MTAPGRVCSCISNMFAVSETIKSGSRTTGDGRRPALLIFFGGQFVGGRRSLAKRSGPPPGGADTPHPAAPAPPPPVLHPAKLAHYTEIIRSGNNSAHVMYAHLC